LKGTLTLEAIHSQNQAFSPLYHKEVIVSLWFVFKKIVFEVILWNFVQIENPNFG
jgi:hypothetical protein